MFNSTQKGATMSKFSFSTTTPPVDNFAFGDYVQTSRHNFKGRILEFVTLCDNKIVRDWLKEQSLPVTDQQRDGVWVRILVHNGGSVLAPADSVSKIEAFDFKNRDADKCFAVA